MGVLDENGQRTIFLRNQIELPAPSLSADLKNSFVSLFTNCLSLHRDLHHPHLHLIIIAFHVYCVSLTPTPSPPNPPKPPHFASSFTLCFQVGYSSSNYMGIRFELKFIGDINASCGERNAVSGNTSKTPAVQLNTTLFDVYRNTAYVNVLSSFDA